jgi:hypothetical protein
MSKALRGDFERLRERGVSVTLSPRDTPTPEPEPVEAAGPLVEAPPEPAVEPPEAPAAEPEPEPVPEPETTGELAGSEEPETSQPGWFGRLLGR